MFTNLSHLISEVKVGVECEEGEFELPWQHVPDIGITVALMRPALEMLP